MHTDEKLSVGVKKYVPHSFNLQWGHELYEIKYKTQHKNIG